MTSKPRNPRRVTIAAARGIGKRFQHIVRLAEIHSGSVYLDQAHRPPDGSWRRPRLPEEFAERMPDFWRDVVVQCALAQHEAAELERFARAQYAEITGRMLGPVKT